MSKRNEWQSVRLKYLADFQKGRLPSATSQAPTSETDVPYLSMEYLRGETNAPSYTPFEPVLLLANEGDILLLWDGSNAGEFMRSKRGAVSSTTARVLNKNNKKIDREFLFWTCKDAETSIRSETVGMGIPHVNGDFLSDCRMLVPPLAEQRAIAGYLDQETGRLDALVAAKERWLELLAEKRRALITHAVTCGINPAAPLRDSGFPWLGQVPKHWRVERNAFLFRERDERGCPELPLLEVSINTGVTLRQFSDDQIESVADDFNSYKVARKGDLAFNKMRMWQGAVGIAPEDGLVSPDYTVAVPLGSLLPDYTELLFRTGAFSAECCRNSHGIVWDRLRIYWDGFRDIRVPVPPLPEQRAIVAHIATATAKLDALRAATERTIALLKERRAALIAAAVTGKIAVPTRPASGRNGVAHEN